MALGRQPQGHGLDDSGSARSAALGDSILTPSLPSTSGKGASSASWEQKPDGQWAWEKPHGLQRPAEGIQGSRRPRLSPRKGGEGQGE